MLSIITSTKDLTMNEAHQKLLFFDQLRAVGVEFEWVVQDCNASESILQLLDQFDFISLESEPDSGVYSAWNKAITRARGDKVCFLGIDDFPKLEWLIFANKIKIKGYEAISCDVLLKSQDNESLGIFNNLKIGSHNINRVSFAPPGLIFSRDIYQKGKFLEKYFIISDGIFYSSLKVINVVAYFGDIGVEMTVGGVSNSPLGARRRLHEFIRALSLGEMERTANNFNRLVLANLPSYLLSFFPSIYIKAQKLKWKLK